MRPFAFFVNLIVLLFIVFFIREQPPRNEEWVIAGIVFMYPVLNIVALMMGKDDWLRLFFKRKALEEMKRIESLKADLTEKQK